MKPLEWTKLPYRRTLPRPIVTAHGRYDRREGFILCVRDNQGRIGLGDAAPLPGFSKETLDDVVNLWPQVSDEVERLHSPSSPADLAQVYATLAWGLACPTSLCFAVESALADLAARKAGVPLAQWLNSHAEPSLEVNALLHGDDNDELRHTVQRRSAEGYRTFKLKAGTSSVSEDIGRVRLVSEAVPTAAVRIDVNGGWTEEQLEDFCSQLSGLNLEFIEQPLTVGKAKEARAITHDHDLRLALDEEAATVQEALHLVAQNLCDVIVLKPMIYGGLSGTWQLAHQALASGVDVMFTSAWETDIGLAATMHLAAACGNGVRASGLSTAGMLAEGLVHPALQIVDGRLAIQKQPGLGLELADSIKADA